MKGKRRINKSAEGENLVSIERDCHNRMDTGGMGDEGEEILESNGEEGENIT